MQEDINLKDQFHLNKSDPNQSADSQIEMESNSNYQAPPNRQQGNQQMGPPSSDRSSLLSNNQLQARYIQNIVQDIQTRIKKEFWCYTFLVYFALLISILILVFNIIVANAIGAGAIVFTSIITFITIIACLLALNAKAGFRKQRQYIAFLMFCLAAMLNTVSNIMTMIGLEDLESNYVMCNDPSNNSPPSDCANTPDYAASIIVSILTIPLQLIFGLALSCSSFTLLKLMRERDDLLEDAQAE